MLKKILFLLLIINTRLYAQIIPSNVRSIWSGAGVEGAIPSPQNSIDVTLFGAIPNDGLDDFSAVVNAISSLNGNAGVVLFPYGTYNLSSVINLPDSVILRGGGATQTLLNFNFNNNPNNCFNISRGQSGSFTSIVFGYYKDSKAIVVINASQNFNVGDAIQIRQTNGSWDTNPATWAANSVGHMSTIDSINADTIYLHEALRINFDASLNPQIRKIVPRSNCGLECFSFTRSDTAAASINYGVYFSYAYNCWINGVEIYKTIGAQVFAEASNHISITGNYFHDSYLYDGASTRGYGVALAVHTGACLVENNIFRRLRHAMMVKQGANGNVFAYNYSREPKRSEPINDFAGDINCHGHYPFANLFEGNVAQNITIDQAWGPNGPYNTFFRNRAELYGLLMSSGTVQSDTQNFVGNDITNMGGLMGFYALYGTGHFEHGNNVKGVITPAGTQSLADSSYYLTAVPTFWNMVNAWPNIGTPNTAGASNPAQDRYSSGSYTVCNSGVFTEVINNEIPNVQLAISNLLFTENEISFTINNANTNTCFLKLCDMFGRIILQKQLNVSNATQQFIFELSRNLAEGIYIMSVYNSTQSISVKCIKR